MTPKYIEDAIAERHQAEERGGLTPDSASRVMDGKPIDPKPIRPVRLIDRDRLSQETEIAVILSAVKCELERAIEKHGPMHSTQEAFGVIYEEFNIEFGSAMHANDLPQARKEMIQVAAMACRFLLDVREEF